MGTPTEPDGFDYEEGDECVACAAGLFEGRTPKYVKAIFQGLVACPGNPPPPDIPTFIIAQHIIFNCQWSVAFFRPEGFWECLWEIDNGGPGLRSILRFTLDAAPGFEGRSDSKCTAGFENFWDIDTCAWLMGGTGVVRWGNEITQADYDAQF